MRLPAEPCLARVSASSLPWTPAWPRIQERVTELQLEASLSSEFRVAMQSLLDEVSAERAWTDESESVKMATEDPELGSEVTSWQASLIAIISA